MDRRDAPAISANGAWLSYGELAAEVQRRAAGLRDFGIGRGSVVGVHTGSETQNSLEFVFWSHAVFWLGATLVPLHSKASAAELDFQLSQIPFDLLLVDDASLLGIEASTAKKTANFNELLVPAGAECPPADIDGDDVMTVLFTSGTSGRPKAVPLTVQNHLSSASASAMRLGLCEDDHWLCCLPLCHIGGLAILVRSAVYGTSFELVESFDAPRIRNLLAEKRVTLASFVPTMLYRLLDESDALIASKLRAVLIGGGPIDAKLLRDARRRGLPVLPTYGMTEACSQLATLSPHANSPHGSSPDRLGTAGAPLDGVEIRIENADGGLCERGEIGRIRVRGPMLTRGYLGQSTQPTDPRFRDGWFDTGDRGRLDADGFLHIEHRISDLIVTGGENVDPGEVAGVLREAGGVGDLAVVGLDDPEWGQIVAAAVVCADAAVSSDEFLAELERRCRTKLAPFKVPRRWRLVGEIPRTASGKIHRNRARELFAATDAHDAIPDSDNFTKNIQRLNF
jgi:O-succinylbenzoic acid--CoA ligase